MYIGSRNIYMSKDILMYDLNPSQREAVLYTKGPLLILAGAGSGKTEVISRKFCYLVKSKGISPDSIFTVTFTNRAADEMRGRISCILDRIVNTPWIGTVHSHCYRILRKDLKILKYNNNFIVYDEDDQHNLLRHILNEFKIHEALYKGIASRINSFKSNLIGPEEFLSSGDGFGFDEKLAKVYVRYQDELRRSNALDFDDLVLLTVKLFEKNPNLLEKYQGLFSYILVDDFQDVNHAQYYLLKLLTSAHKKICVIGDDDQSLCKFKGAGLNNIINFKSDFSGVKLIEFEQNYRSTQNILTVSSAVIAQNPERKYKKLWTDRSSGENVYHCWFNTFDEEAKYISKTIKEFYLKGKYDYKDFVIFYRINLQSKALEEALRAEGLPYRIFGSTCFYLRREIKDIIAYMRLSFNHGDNVSLRRIINCPPRGISAAALSRIENEAKKKSLSLFDAIKVTLRTNNFTTAVKGRLIEFVKLIENFSALTRRSAAEVLKNILEKSGYAETLDEERTKNIAEFISSVEGKDVREFLNRISLFTTMEEITRGDYISLMPLHGAKGLEFPVVFIIGLEEGVLPYCKALKGKNDIAEERKLFYLGMTRAKNLLWLTGASKRKLYARVQDQEPSRFLKEIPRDCCQWIERIKTQQAIKLEPAKKKIEPRRILTLYTAGCRVKHPTWGIGVVRDCYGDGEDQKVTVNFHTIGLKRLAVKFANLERL